MRQPRFHEVDKELWDEIVKRRKELRENRIPIDKCVKGRLYKLACRNLGYGVYDGDSGFIGLREKFGNVYLFTEIHWDEGPPFGTVEGMRDTGVNFLGLVSELNKDLFDWLKGKETEYERD